MRPLHRSQRVGETAAHPHRTPRTPAAVKIGKLIMRWTPERSSSQPAANALRSGLNHVSRRRRRRPPSAPPAAALGSGKRTTRLELGEGGRSCAGSPWRRRVLLEAGSSAVSIFSIRRTTLSISVRAAALRSAMRAPVPAALPAERDLVERAVGDEAEHHRVFHVDMAAEGAGKRDARRPCRRRSGPSAA